MVFVIDETQLYSLLGHLLFGITLGIAMCWLSANAALEAESAERQRVADDLRLLNVELEQRVQERTAELDDERAQLKAILDAMGEGVIYKEQRHSKYINQALSRMTGYNLADFDEGYPDLLGAEQRSETDHTDLLGGVHESIWRFEIKVRRKDGTEFDAALTCTRVASRDGRPTGTVTIVRDISAEKQLQEQKGRFIANASHELRTPLTNFKTRLYLLRKQPDQSHTHIAALEHTTNYMAGLLEDLLDITRFEHGMIQLRCEHVILQDLITATVESQQLEAARKNIALQVDLPPAPLHALIDPKRLTQVLTNLITNAINYTAENGVVSLRLLDERDDHAHYAVIHVQDTGVGIAAEHLNRIFEPFFRVKSESTQGTGLGLSIAQEIVQLHGGLITVESALGAGSVFSIKLPIAADNRVA
jgi:PAS domain S-box-containing protein